MIVSASYRTDIPAFYGDWFLNRLRAGHCTALNPYNSRPYRVSLAPGDVDGFVFWTRDVRPFLPALAEVRERGIPFVVQYSITGYPAELEGRPPANERRSEDVRLISREYGPRAVVWRYDTVLLTSLTTPGFHVDNFARLARMLEGSTDEVVVSFAQIYRKTRGKLDRAARERGFTWENPPVEAKRSLIGELASAARGAGMRLTVCGQRELLAPGVEDASCIDAARLRDAGSVTAETGGRSHREGCGCAASRDIGAYGTCTHGCVFCYAVSSHDAAVRRRRAHDPRAESL